MKTFISLLIAGMLLVITGALLKIENTYEYSNYILGLGLILEIISVIGIIKGLRKSAKL
ncbi:hypothetical protein [Flavobacterium sp. SM2513]|uniref:hypothetical protein n=1 Tax=Flavobacterium sp. SM2513 TaxID=3424766 RepID=UPI003D7F9F6C